MFQVVAGRQAAPSVRQAGGKGSKQKYKGQGKGQARGQGRQ